MTIHIPDWLFDGHFWAGFGTAIAPFFALSLYWTNNFNP